MLDEDFLIVATFNLEFSIFIMPRGSHGVKKKWSYETFQTVEVSNGVGHFKLFKLFKLFQHFRLVNNL